MSYPRTIYRATREYMFWTLLLGAALSLGSIAYEYYVTGPVTGQTVPAADAMVRIIEMYAGLLAPVFTFVASTGDPPGNLVADEETTLDIAQKARIAKVLVTIFGLIFPVTVALIAGSAGVGVWIGRLSGILSIAGGTLISTFFGKATSRA